MSLFRRSETGPWWYKFVFEGKRYQVSTKTKNRRLAEQIEAKAKAQIVEHKAFPNRQTVSLTELWTHWAEHSSEKVSLDRDRFRWGHLMDCLGPHTPARQVTREDIDRWLRTVDKAPKTVKHYRDTARAIFNLALDRGYIAANPARGAKIPRQPEARDREITEEEFDAILENHWCSGVTWALVLGWYCGLRLREAVELTWDRIDLDERLIRLEAEHTKTRTRRKVPIPEELAEMLEEWTDEEREGRLTTCKANNVTLAWTRACQDLGIENARFHDLRHSYGTRLRRAKVDQWTIAKVMGHTSLQTTKQYMEHDDDDLRAAIEGL